MHQRLGCGYAGASSKPSTLVFRDHGVNNSSFVWLGGGVVYSARKYM